MTDQAWPEPGQADVEAWLGEAVRLAREAGNMIAAAMAGQQNTEIHTKEERGGEGNGSAVLTETDGRWEGVGYWTGWSVASNNGLQQGGAAAHIQTAGGFSRPQVYRQRPNFML